MIALLSVIGVGMGSLGILLGLLMIEPQVRVHQIEVYSRAVGCIGWAARVGQTR